MTTMVAEPRRAKVNPSWEGFQPGIWQNEINVRDFIQQNYEPYDGDDSFLTGATRRTHQIWATLQALFVDAENHRDGAPQRALREPREHRRVLRFVPLHCEFVGDTEDEAIALERDRFRGLDPRLEVLFMDLAPGVVQNAVPRFFERQLHAIVRSSFGREGDRDVVGAGEATTPLWKSQP